MKTERGFTLVEVLVALLVLSVGLLALAGFQAMLSRHADLARQRTEASQLAQSKLDEMRGFSHIDGGSPAYGDIASGFDAPTISSNATYRREWRVEALADQPFRRIGLQVQWTDRSGETASVALAALIARADPTESARLAWPTPANSARWTPARRNLAVPADAIPLGGANRGRSRWTWDGASGGVLVFDDASGVLLAQCATVPGDTTDLAVSCTPMPAYLLRGYLSGDWAEAVTGIAFVATEHLLAAPECVIAAARNQNDGSLIADMRSYACLLRPSDHDGNAGTPRAWSGRTQLEPPPAGSRLVCRYTTDATTTDNENHPARYVLVTHSLAQQNFLVVAAGPCPPNTAPHQP